MKILVKILFLLLLNNMKTNEPELQPLWSMPSTNAGGMIPSVSDTESNLLKDYMQRKKTMNADIIYEDIDIDSMHNLEFVQPWRTVIWR